MANKTISQLPAAASANASAVVAADNAGGTLTEKVTLSQIATLANSSLAAVATSGDYEDLTNTPPVVVSDPTGITGADAITNIVSLTQAEYDALTTPDPATLYVIV